VRIVEACSVEIRNGEVDLLGTGIARQHPPVERHRQLPFGRACRLGGWPPSQSVRLRLKINGLFMTKSCCRGVVVSSRSGLCRFADGKSLEAQQRIQIATAHLRVHGTTAVLGGVQVGGGSASRGVERSRSFPTSSRDMPRHPGGEDSLRQKQVIGRIDLASIGARFGRLPVGG